MTSIIRFTPLSGAQDETPLAYLLQVDEFKFLLDCGWDEMLNLETIENIKRYASQVDAVLVSHPDIYHIGALPYLVGKCNLNCPIYATIPVYKMGQMFMYDFYQSHQNVSEFDLYSLDDVDAAFDQMVQLKYSQHVSLKGRGHGLSITPYTAGHMIGGTMWKITKEGEEDIIYAVDYNHKKEIHLNGAVLETLSRPAILITDAYTALEQPARRRDRDMHLMNTILSAVRNDGNVLLAVDTAGRMLELTQLLDQLWKAEDSGLIAYSLAVLNNVSYNVVEFAKSQVDWMSERMTKSLMDDNRANPFAFKHITLCHNLKELEKIPEPKVVLASCPDLESGFSRDLFIQWAGNPKNSVIFTFKTAPTSLARRLIDHPSIGSIELMVKRKVPLEGEELHRFIEGEKEKQRFAKLNKTAELKRHESVFQEESDSESEDEADKLNATQVRSKYDLMVADDKKRSSCFKQAKMYPMYPFKEERLKWDDYGEIIKAEDYIITEPTMTLDDDVLAPATNIKQVEQVQDEMEALGMEMSEIPTKCVSEIKYLEVKCQISYIDFEGRSDGQSVERILNLVKPRQLILIHGVPAATQKIAKFCETTASLNVSKIYMPHTGEVVDATRESHIYQVKLKDSLVSSLRFAQALETELAWIDGQLILESRGERFDQSRDGEEPMEEDTPQNQKDVVPALEQLSQDMIPGHATVFVDEPRLSDFKQVLNKAGIQAEFIGGSLVFNNRVNIRKVDGKITVEGALCDEYYTIRDLLYDQYAIV